LNFNEYQHAAGKTASYPDIGNNLLYPALGLAGEAGEAVDKIKKWWRNHGITSGKQLSEEQVHLLSLELGDVLWYINGLATEIGISLEYVAELNINKLYDRVERGVVNSEGDTR
jgi:NTP pyrophosphatase (non-canonical NTP hydrolase)